MDTGPSDADHSAPEDSLWYLVGKPLLEWGYMRPGERWSPGPRKLAWLH